MRRRFTGTRICGRADERGLKTKRVIALILCVILCLPAVSAHAASDEMTEAADALHALGLFRGVGTAADGTPIYDLDRAPTRAEAAVMLVRLLGKETEVLGGRWQTPFGDVPAWAAPYVGYAYTYGLTNGVSEDRFGSDTPISAAQYITLVLRALRYSSEEDFRWDTAYELSDRLGITDGRYQNTDLFTRGDAALISWHALYTAVKGSDMLLIRQVNGNLDTARSADGGDGDAEAGQMTGTEAYIWLEAVDTDTADEHGKTDMTPAIMELLESTGYCHLGPGIFYVSGGIDLPAGATLEGCGKNTVVRLLSDAESGYICRIHTRSTVRGICFSGAPAFSAKDIASDSIGDRNGIIYIGNHDGKDPDVTPKRTTCCMISECWFENFSGSAILGHNSGYGLDDGIVCTNCYIQLCAAGINLNYYTEYCKFTNIVVSTCHYACINNGGNNTFTACTFHGTVGFLMDNSARDKGNNSHGSVIGCIFNHADNWNRPETLGGGYGVKILGCQNGMIFSGCQFFYGMIHIEDSIGMQFSDCLFGGSTPQELEVSGTYGAFLNDCVFLREPMLNVNDATRFSSCYHALTGALIAAG